MNRMEASRVRASCWVTFERVYHRDSLRRRAGRGKIRSLLVGDSEAVQVRVREHEAKLDRLAAHGLEMPLARPVHGPRSVLLFLGQRVGSNRPASSGLEPGDRLARFIEHLHG